MLYASLLTIGLVASASAQAPRKFARGFKRSLTPPGEAVTSLNITAEEVAAAPAAVDWSYALTPIKDQGSCGSCWAFSTTEGVESAVFRSTGQLPPPLSTEQLVDCEKQDDGCDGGDIPEAIRYLKRKGMATDSDYPDRSSQSGRTRQCTWDGDYDVTVTGMSFAIPQCDRGDCSYQDEDKLAAAVAKYGPLSVCINSGDGQPGGARAPLPHLATHVPTAGKNRKPSHLPSSGLHVRCACVCPPPLACMCVRQIGPSTSRACGTRSAKRRPTRSTTASNSSGTTRRATSPFGSSATRGAPTGARWAPDLT